MQIYYFKQYAAHFIQTKPRLRFGHSEFKYVLCRQVKEHVTTLSCCFLFFFTL